MTSRILISGASGMVGRNLTRYLESVLPQPEVLHLVRHTPRSAREIWWDPSNARIDISRCEGFDAVVHLAGENIGSGSGGLSALTGRWSEEKKHSILESRRKGTLLLAQTLAAVRRKPRVLVSASGVGYYGVGAGEGEVGEGAPKGGGYLAEVADVWEASTAPAAGAGVRVVNLRLGVVLSGEGGPVEKLKLPFSLGLGGPIGSGKQWFSWVALEDAVRIVQYAITNETLTGPVNACSPQPVRNEGFVGALGKALHRPAFIPMPEFVVKGVFGEMGEETLLANIRAVPTKLEKSGFVFKYPGIDQALQACFQR